MIRIHLSKILFDRKQGGKNLSLSELSEVTGLNRGTLSKMVNHPTEPIGTDVINRLCWYLKVGVADLLVYEPHETDPPDHPIHQQRKDEAKKKLEEDRKRREEAKKKKAEEMKKG